MGKVPKAANERHEATLSPFFKAFVEKSRVTPLRNLRSHLADFPALWPFPRGDLYHWIPALDRFDDILDKFNRYYGLNKGPQIIPFGSKLVEEKEPAEDKGKSSIGTSIVRAEESDVELIKAILSFTSLLLANCGNRSLYSSSDRLNDLLHTTDLSLLQRTFQLSLLLAKRYYSSKQRMHAVGHNVHLSAHYNINVERVRKIAAPFSAPTPPAPRQPDTPSASAKGRDKKLARSSKSSLRAVADPKLNAADLVAIVKDNSGPPSWKPWADVKLTFYPDKAWLASNGRHHESNADDQLETPVIRRTTTSPSEVARAARDHNVIAHRRRSLGDDSDALGVQQISNLEIDGDDILSQSVGEVFKQKIEETRLPEASHFDLLHRLRVAKALSSSRENRLAIVAIRLLAIANLAYIESEPTFYAEFARTDSEQPRQLQVAFQLAELVQPPSDHAQTDVPLELQHVALLTMEALIHQKFRANDIYTAVNANVNHGILFYMVRKAIDQLRIEEDSPQLSEEEWREALFSLLSSLPTIMPRAGDLMMSAGLLDILLEVLALRTKQAKRTHWKAVMFLDNFVYSVRDGYQTFANAKGLDVAKDLAAHVVTTSFERQENGSGMPNEYRAPITDYKIPFYQQQTLRWLFKFINHLMANTNANFSRQMRNLVDSPEMLEGFRKVMSHATIYGSNVWAGAVSIWTTFINNEPTSYSVIAESKLGECFLDTLTASAATATQGDRNTTLTLLPVSEAINAVPQAFQALCLNEAGMNLLTGSGALKKFFNIFSSPPHVKALEQDRQLAQNLGGAFDELCRHQPSLRKDISDAVCMMVSDVARLCHDQAVQGGIGAKLWVANGSGQLSVAGGRAAFASQGQGGKPVNDVQMIGSEHGETDHLPLDHVAAAHKPSQGPLPNAYIATATRFLIGYLANSSMCVEFIKSGGVESALDLATSPCLPFSFEEHNCGHLQEELTRMLSLLAESKIHILLPSMVYRLQRSLFNLQTFTSHDDPSCGFFARFTNQDRKSNIGDLSDPTFAAGTICVKSMVTVNIISYALCIIFAGLGMYSHRPQNNVFQQVNLTDVWVDIVRQMSKLQRSCTWESILLTANLPQDWLAKTGKQHPPESDEAAERILGFSSPRGDEGSDSIPPPPLEATNVDFDASADVSPADSTKKSVRSPQFENARVLRYLFTQTPHEISQLFNSMGKLLLVRRPDTMQKQNAAIVGEELAKSTIDALTYALPQQFGETKRLHEYWTVILTRVSSLMIDDAYERTSPQTLTLILRSFKEHEGFQALERVLSSYVKECKELVVEENKDSPHLRDLYNHMAGIKMVLHFYSRVINAKLVTDASQTQALAGRSSDSNSSDFSPAQFLVEVRYAVLKPAMRLWDESESAFMDKAITAVVRNLIEVMKIQLDADGESKALTRKDKAPVKKSREYKKWSPKHNSDLERLAEEYSQSLALEALYRCHDNTHHAAEYADYVQNILGEPFLPLASDVTAARDRSRSSSRPRSATDQPHGEISAASRTGPANTAAPMLIDLNPDDMEGGSAAPRLPQLPLDASALREMMLGTAAPIEGEREGGDGLLRGLFTGIESSREASESPAPREDTRPLAGKVQGLVTVDDLNELRADLRANLIDRCLGILSVHDDVTFELSELIFASVKKGSASKESQAEIASTLLLSLTSLELEEGANPEDAKQQNKRVSSYAHLFALVLAREEFYTVIEEELLENFSTLVSFIKPESIESGSNAVANILLVVERLLSSDAMPQQVEYKLPNPDADIVERPAVLEKTEPVVCIEDKQALFEALLKVMLSVRRNETIALSILRILVILTRDRTLAARLGEKPNLSRLFLVARQLFGMTDDKIQGAFLVVLRHIVEDDEILHNIMCNEIVAAWSNRPHGRPFDTTTYCRHFSQMAFRSPEIFIRATNDKVAISNYNTRQGPQALRLKEDPVAQTRTEAADVIDEKLKATGVEGGTHEAELGGKDKIEIERAKSHELKMPLVENPDGVIHFILGELLNYKEVSETHPPRTSPSKTPISDVDMGNASSTSAVPPNPTSGSGGPESVASRSEKPAFVAEEHPVYIYRCFLLQCLTELLSCYNQTKIEFINFKRKGDSSVATPSKPRSQVLTYLLHDLIPTGTLSHPDDFEAKKRDKVSTWAMSVIVALCSKTGEGGLARLPADFTDYKEEPELLFVRKFVLEHAIKSYRDAMTNESEGLEKRYSRLLSLADLFNRMLTGKPNGGANTSTIDLEMLVISQRMLAKIMYEKNFISAMTSSIAEIDLNFPNSKRAVKYILKPLKLLTQTANDLSLHSTVPIAPGSADEEEFSSDSEDASEEEVREQTPDLFRNSALGILEPNHDDESDDGEEDDVEDDEEMYGDEYGEEMEYEEEMHDHDEVVSDEEHELAEMGPIEGLSGDVGVDMEIVGMDVEEDDEDDDGDSSELTSSDEDDEDSEGDDMDDIIDIDIEGPGADDEEWESQPDDEDEADAAEEGMMGGPTAWPAGDLMAAPRSLDDIVRVLERGEHDEEILQRIENQYLDGDMPDVNDMMDGEMPEEDDDEEEEEYDEEEIAFEPEVDGEDEDFDIGRGVPWGWEEGERGAGHRHHHHHVGHRHSPWGLFSDFRERILPSYGATRRGAESQRRADDGINPLLQRPGMQANRSSASVDFASIGPGATLGRIQIPDDSNPTTFLNSLITAMSAGTVMPHAISQRGGAVQLTFNQPDLLMAGLGRNTSIRDLEDTLLDRTFARRHTGADRTTRDDPSSAVVFTPALTVARWTEEARILFGNTHQDKALRLVNAILRLLVPPAIEEMKKKEKEEKELQEKLEAEREKARKEKEERERKEKEERDAKEKREREEREAAEAEAAAARAADNADGQMEGVESTAPEVTEQTDTQSDAAEGTGTESEPAQRITTMIDGREIDITNLGIDPDYLEALPEDMRQEVIMEQTIAQRQTAATTGGQETDLDPEFLEALPQDMRVEIQQQLALERRRQEREQQRRVAAEARGEAARPDDMDPATFFATLDPALRSQLLMEVDDESLGALPPQLQAEARQLSGHHRRLDHYANANNRSFSRVGPPGAVTRTGAVGEEPVKRKPTVYAQILDKAGVATLLRLMFVQQSGSVRSSLNGILRDVCHNKQNRAEVVSILLSILQDGSNDVGAVERSFSLLSLRAKQPASVQKTPQIKRTLPDRPALGISEMSPITVVQQCLVCLETLVQYNPRIAEFFLTEHEMVAGLKPRSTKKGKGKESRAIRYPINALLGLLDRDIIVESASVMELLASLLQRITHPLIVLLRREKEKDKSAEEQKDNVDSAAADCQLPADADRPQTATSDVIMASPQLVPEPTGEASAVPPTVENTEGNSKVEDAADDKVKKRALVPPEVPEYNLRLIINIIAARECPSKTFKDTLSLITNLSTIPKAKEIFGQELIQQAQGLGRNIFDDLQELEGQIRKATNGADVQGMALAKFSPASSDQAKLLRVITALDFLFDPKRAETQDKPATADAQGMGRQQKEDILTTLYESKIFASLWEKLSFCMKEIHERENMFSVANILLPLIEVLMVVCKNTTLKDAPIKNTQQDFSLASPEPESKEQRMEGLFFRFTEDHRKILNELVRHNPKLMSGSFSLLVKNSKVLEFDNKRNYFTRRLHQRGQEVRQSHSSLQLSVRRDQVFLDSFKHLYYKKPEEFKYGKLSIRFAGEEGVDAGGVTREWFQALTKQMFDANYALFTPVAADRTTFHPNSESHINEQHLTFFKFIGRIIGKALYEGRVLDCHFSRAVYKRILGRSISIKDMESLDNDYAKNLQWILDNDITDLITETFSVSTDVFGEQKTVDLIPNGRDIEVNEENKADYVQRVVEYKLIGSVKEQMEHFLQGFHDIVPADLVSIFNEQELELLISGLPDIDVDDWRNNTEYHNYTSSSPQIQWFWRAVRSFDKEERAKLLQFVTGTSKVPLNGFKELEGMNGFSRFNIHRDYGNKDRLPSSHTCFNQLDLPEYECYEDLRKQLYTAITTGSEYFGFA